MCLYPILIKNPKYQPNKKNKGTIPTMIDKRLGMVPVGCGECIECRKMKANEWRVRLTEELKQAGGAGAYFVTLTFNDKTLKAYENCDPNKVAAHEVRLFLERWRAKWGKSLRHWLIPELGHDNTERLHLHGIVWTNHIDDLEKRWGNGWVHIGEYCTQRTINYIIKYVLKVDQDHPKFVGKILCSKGLGKGYLKRNLWTNEYKGEDTKEYYITPNGLKVQLPNYYRNKIYSEEQKELLWLDKLDKKEIYVMGVKHKVETQEDIKNYLNALKTAQKNNEIMGYGNSKWKKKKYLEDLVNLNK